MTFSSIATIGNKTSRVVTIQESPKLQLTMNKKFEAPLFPIRKIENIVAKLVRLRPHEATSTAPMKKWQ